MLLFQLHYTSHTKYDISHQQAFHTSTDESEKSPRAQTKSPSGEVDEPTVDAGDETIVEEATPLPPQSIPFPPTDVGRSADLYASIVLQKIPQVCV